MQPAWFLMRDLSVSVRGGRHSLVVFFDFPTEGVELLDGRSVSCERRSFFLLQHTAQAAVEVSMSFCVQASLAHMQSFHSFTSKAQAARSVANMGSRLRLSLRLEWRLNCSWTLSWTLVRARAGAEVARIAFRFSISIFQLMKTWLP